MSFFADPTHWALIAVAFTSGGMLVWPLVRGGAQGGAVGANEAVRLINREKAVLIDVSEPAEFAAGHAGSARNVPLAGITTAGKELPSNKALPLVVMCPTGARARRAVVELKKLGYERAVALAGGLAAWREANLPTEKSAEKSPQKATA